MELELLILAVGFLGLGVVALLGPYCWLRVSWLVMFFALMALLAYNNK